MSPTTTGQHSPRSELILGCCRRVSGPNLTAPQQVRFTEDGFSEDSGTLIYCPGQTDSVLSLGLSVSSTGQTRQLENGLS